ncbi:MAG: oligosaccharide flippase family protein [Thermoguttaceae bacterium]
MSEPLAAAAAEEAAGLLPLELPKLPEPAAPATPKRSMRFLVGSMATGNMISALLSMVGGILMMRLVAPKTLGLFTGIGLIQQYLPFLQIGVLNGMNRELPFFVGKGDHHRVRELASVAQAWALLLGGVSGLALLGVAAWQLVLGQWWPAAGWATNAILAFLLFYKTWYLQYTYRTSNDFARLALATVVENTVAFLLLGLVALLNFYGMCFRVILAGLVGTALLHYWRPVRVGPSWKFHHFKHLLAIGAPIFVVNQILSVWTPLNSNLVLWYMGTEGMGLYYVAITAVNALEILPLAVGAVLYPRLAEQYGRTGNVHDLLRVATKPTAMTFAAMIPICILSWVLVGPVVAIVGPKYLGAVPAVQWSLLIPLLTSLTPVGLIFNVIRRQDLYLVAILLGIGSYFGSLRWLISGGVSLIAFPQAMAIGRLVYVVACYALVVHHRRRVIQTERA